MTYNDIVTALKEAGIAVYHPGARAGVCTEPYTVVQDSGTYQYAASRRLGYTLVLVHCYVPLGNYPALALLAGRVKDALRPLLPDLRPTGNEGLHEINDTFRAHESTVEYLIQKKLF